VLLLGKSLIHREHHSIFTLPDQANNVHHISRGLSHFRDPHDVTWDIPRNAIVNQVEEVWGIYLREFFAPPRTDSWQVNPCSFVCSLIPHYRELTLTYWGDKVLWACLRRPADGSTPRKRALMLRYVSMRLSLRAERNQLVIVAYGADVEVYIWKGRNHGIRQSLELLPRYQNYGREGSRIKFETETLEPL
jgi:hypothetical protein